MTGFEVLRPPGPLIPGATRSQDSPPAAVAATSPSCPPPVGTLRQAPMDEKTECLEMRVPEGLLRKLNEWRRKQEFQRGGRGGGLGSPPITPDNPHLPELILAREQTPLLCPGARHVEALRDPASARQRP